MAHASGRFLVIGLALMMGLAGCANLGDRLSGVDRPFQPGGKDELPTELLDLPRHVLIEQVKGLPPEQGSALAKAVAKASSDREIIATTTAPPQRTNVLMGEYSMRMFEDTPVRQLRWSFRSPNGHEVQRFSVLEPIVGRVDEASEQAGAPGSAMNRLAQLSAIELVTLVKERTVDPREGTPGPAVAASIDEPERTAVPGRITAADGPEGQPVALLSDNDQATISAANAANASAAAPVPRAAPARSPRTMTFASNRQQPEVYFLPILGAPGDGRRSLSRAFASRLTERGVVLVNEPGPKTYLVQSVITLSDKGPKSQLVEIEWDLSRSNGEVLANLYQANEINRGTLDGEWGPIASDIADGVIDDVVDTLSKFFRP